MGASQSTVSKVIRTLARLLATSLLTLLTSMLVGRAKDRTRRR